MTHPEHRVTLIEYLEVELKNQMGPHQPNISGKWNFLTQFRKDVTTYFRNEEISEAQKEQLLQDAQQEQEKLEQEEAGRKAQEEQK